MTSADNEAILTRKMQKTVDYDAAVNEVRLVLTNRCNFRCYFCFNEGYSTTSRSSVLEIDDYLRILSYLSSTYNLRKVRLTGGEPLLDRRAAPLVSAIMKELPSLDCGVTTNGAFPDRVQEITDIQCRGLLRINVSLPATSLSSFRASTGSGRLPDVLRSIKIASRSRADTKINCVVSSRSEASAVIALGQDLGVPVKLLCMNVNPHNSHAIDTEEAASGANSIACLLSSLGYSVTGPQGGLSRQATRGEHVAEIIDCSTSEPVEYFRRFRSLRVYFDAHLAVTGDFDGYWRPFDPKHPEAAVDALVSDLGAARW